MSANDLVMRRAENGIGVLSLNRPHRHNAFDDALLDAFDRAVTWVIETSAIRAVVLRGEGPSFSAGRDTSQLGLRPPGVTDESFVLACQATRKRLIACPKPVIAAVKGVTFGGGLETALAADMRIAARSTRIRLPQIEYGVMTSWGGSTLATVLIGPARTKYLVMSGEEINAEQALAWGLVEWVVDDDELDVRAMALARTLADRPPLASALAKGVINQMWAGAIERGFWNEFSGQSALMGSGEYVARRDKLQAARRPDDA